MLSKFKKLPHLLCIVLCLLACLPACNTDSQENTAISNEAQTSEEQDAPPPDGIFRQQKNVTLNGINFTRHQVTIREGQNEETIIYTVFEDKAQFQLLNDLIADYANLARLDSIKISDVNNMETEETEYKTTQRTDSVYMPDAETINIAFSYYFMANGMECENRESKILSYSLKNKKIISLKDVFRASLSTAQEKIQTELKKQFFKNLHEFAENAYEKIADNELDSLKKEITDKKIFFVNLSFALVADSLIFSYPVGRSCSLPPYLSAKMALKDCGK